MLRFDAIDQGLFAKAMSPNFAKSEANARAVLALANNQPKLPAQRQTGANQFYAVLVKAS